MAKQKHKSYFLIGVDIVDLYTTKGLHVVLEFIKAGKISQEKDFIIVEWEGNTTQIEDVLDKITLGYYVPLHPDEYLAIKIARMNMRWDMNYNSL